LDVLGGLAATVGGVAEFGTRSMQRSDCIGCFLKDVANQNVEIMDRGFTSLSNPFRETSDSIRRIIE
jgi:hypothetical protein